MSRNLGRTDCEYCTGAIRALEPPRLARAADVYRYTERYEGRLWLARAACVQCEAQYLAWYNHRPWPRQNVVPPHSEEIVDLSFLSTFSDEPGEADTPRWLVRKRVVWERLGPYKGGAWDYPPLEEDDDEQPRRQESSSEGETVTPGPAPEPSAGPATSEDVGGNPPCHTGPTGANRHGETCPTCGDVNWGRNNAPRTF